MLKGFLRTSFRHHPDATSRDSMDSDDPNLERDVNRDSNWEPEEPKEDVDFKEKARRRRQSRFSWISNLGEVHPLFRRKPWSLHGFMMHDVVHEFPTVNYVNSESIGLDGRFDGAIRYNAALDAIRRDDLHAFKHEIILANSRTWVERAHNVRNESLFYHCVAYRSPNCAKYLLDQDYHVWELYTENKSKRLKKMVKLALDDKRVRHYRPDFWWLMKNEVDRRDEEKRSRKEEKKNAKRRGKKSHHDNQIRQNKKETPPPPPNDAEPDEAIIEQPAANVKPAGTKPDAATKPEQADAKEPNKEEQEGMTKRLRRAVTPKFAKSSSKTTTTTTTTTTNTNSKKKKKKTTTSKRAKSANGNRNNGNNKKRRSKRSKSTPPKTLASSNKAALPDSRTDDDTFNCTAAMLCSSRYDDNGDNSDVLAFSKPAALISRTDDEENRSNLLCSWHPTEYPAASTVNDVEIVLAGSLHEIDYYDTDTEPDSITEQETFSDDDEGEDNNQEEDDSAE